MAGLFCSIEVEVKKFDSVETDTSEFGRSKRTVSASQLQLGNALRSQVFSFAKGGAGSDSIHNSMINAMSPLYARNILIIRHLRHVVRAADKNTNCAALGIGRISDDSGRAKLASKVDQLG